MRTKDVTASPKLQSASTFSEPDDVTFLQNTVLEMRTAIIPRLSLSAAMKRLQTRFQAETLVINSLNIPDTSAILHQSTALPASLQDHLHRNTITFKQGIVTFKTRDCHAVLVCETVRSQMPLGFLCWKKTSWASQEINLLKTLTTFLAGIQELDGLYKGMLNDAHYDLSSNLLNWKGLAEEIDRRLPRLDQEHLPATLMVLNIPGLSAIGQEQGFVAGEHALSQCIALLRGTIRPTDAIGRLGSNRFALWLDGGDRFAMAERAERMTAHGVPLLINSPVHLPLEMGLVCREPLTTDETPQSLLEHATQALHKAIRLNKKWHFSYEAP